jgi:uncharacterized protein YecA (UPF0149 family)
MDIRQTLIDAGERLEDRTREAVLALGEGAVPDLIGMLKDEDLLTPGGPGDGYAPVHAARLLGELADSRAVEPLLALIVEGDLDELVASAALVALPKHGLAALEPLLAAHDAEADPQDRARFGCLLSELGVKDERVYERLVAHLESDLEMGASSLGAYGDARALPHLCRALDACTADDRDEFAVVELVFAIEELGGELTEEQAAKRAAVMQNRKANVAVMSRTGRFLDAPAGLRLLHTTLEGSKGPSLWQVRGYLAGLATQPSLAQPSTWLPKVLPPASVNPETIDATLRLYNATLDALADDPALLCPMADDAEATAAFCKGYLDAGMSDPEWAPAGRTREELAFVTILAREAGQGEVEGSKELEEARERLPQLLDLIHETLAPVRAELAKRGAAKVAPKVGRNDPCSCGSGKKFKRCCGN